jgi:signal peptidase II
MNGAVSQRLPWLALSAAVLLADQAAKALVRALLPLHDSVELVPSLFSLTHVTNRGALFGILHDLGDPWRGALFTVVPLIAILLIVHFQGRTSPDDHLAQSGLALILGGAAGNFLDRVRLGQVTDFLDVYVGPHHWPAFNIADSAICVGVGLLIADLLWPPQRDGAAHPVPSESPDASRPV